jgi:hypothetical protein
LGRGVRRFATTAAIVTASAGLLAGSAIVAGTASASTTFTGNLNTVTPIASTIPNNGDLNPYAVAVVPRSNGNLQAGNVLVGNFNDSANIQGTGTTIVQVTPGGQVSLFARIGNLGSSCPGGVGLTTALVTLLRFVDMSTVRKVTAVFLLILAAYTAWSAAR